MVGQAGQLGVAPAGFELVEADGPEGLPLGEGQTLAVELGAGQLRVAVGLAGEGVILQLMAGPVAPGRGHLVDGRAVAVRGRAPGLVAERVRTHAAGPLHSLHARATEPHLRNRSRRAGNVQADRPRLTTSG